MATLDKADLRRANFKDADLRLVSFNGADLSKVDLSGANLSYAIIGANLSETDLSGANLHGANFPEASSENDTKTAKLHEKEQAVNNIKLTIAHALGVRAEAIEVLAGEVKTFLGYYLTYDEILAIVQKIQNQVSANEDPASINKYRENAVLRAYHETQYHEFGEKLSLASDYLRLIGADIERGEVWLDEEHLNKMQASFALAGGTSVNLAELLEYTQSCWSEITSFERRYAVPSKGRAEILASVELQKRINLKSLRFLQESAIAPEVFIRFEFQEPPIIGITKVLKDGKVIGFHENVASEALRLLIDAIALSYYRDLVIADKVYIVPQTRVAPKKHWSAKPKEPRTIPRTVKIYVVKRRSYRIDEWYEAQERARHSVVGHIRLVGNDFIASVEKQRQAEEEGIELQDGCTWVREHERGGREEISGLKLDGFDLAEDVVFEPPERASFELGKFIGVSANGVATQ